MDPLLDQEHRELEDGLLRAGRDIGMSPALREKTLAALGMGAAGIAATAAVKSGSLSWLASKGAWLSTKGGALLSVSAVATAGAVAVATLSGGFTESSAERQATQVVDNDARRIETSSVRGEEEPREDSPPVAAVDTPDGQPEREPVAERAAAETPKGKTLQKAEKADAERPPSVLREELSQIALVESALREGQPAKALKLLNEYRASFPRPQLGLEAEVLTIQALYESGSVAAAGKRAQGFLDRHPQSPLGARARQYLK